MLQVLLSISEGEAHLHRAHKLFGSPNNSAQQLGRIPIKRIQISPKLALTTTYQLPRPQVSVII